MIEALVLVAGYLLGSLPTGYLVGRSRGVDIRTVGSGSMGATNVFRAVGGKLASAVMVVDVVKGLAAVLLGSELAGEPWGILAGAAAMAGHTFPIWLRFKGGKGVATGLGVILGALPLAVPILIPIWIAVVGTTRFVSLGSICSAIMLAPIAWTFGASTAETIFAIVAGLAVVALHHQNIRRLARGEELAVSLKRSS